MQDVTKDRDKYIGGSDVPIIMGLSPFKTRWQLLREKAGIVENTFAGNAFTEYGNVMEPKIRDYINDYLGYNFVEDKVEQGFMRYHYDGLDREANLALEIKTTSQIHGHISGYKKYLVQLLTGMKMAGIKAGILAVYERPEDFYEEFDASRLTMFSVSLDEYDSLITDIEIACQCFWNDLETLKENPFLSEEDLQPFPVIAEAQIVCQLEEQLSEMKDIERQCKAAKENLKQAMESYNIKTWTTPNGTKITLVPDGEDKMVREFDQKRFEAENSALMEPYMVDKVKKGRAGYVKITLPKI